MNDYQAVLSYVIVLSILWTVYYFSVLESVLEFVAMAKFQCVREKSDYFLKRQLPDV